MREVVWLCCTAQQLAVSLGGGIGREIARLYIAQTTFYAIVAISKEKD